jgi:hypothetical protein
MSWLPSSIGRGQSWRVAGAAEPAHATAAHAVGATGRRGVDLASPLEFLDAKDAGSEDRLRSGWARRGNYRALRRSASRHIHLVSRVHERIGRITALFLSLLRRPQPFGRPPWAIPGGPSIRLAALTRPGSSTRTRRRSRPRCCRRLCERGRIRSSVAAGPSRPAGSRRAAGRPGSGRTGRTSN